MIAPPALSTTASPAQAPTLPPDLRELLRNARASAPELALVTARLERARVAAQAAGAERLPRLEGTLASGRSREAAPAGEAEVRNRHRAGLDLTWEVDLWGRLARVKEAAVREAQASAEDLRAAWLLLESEIVDAYAQLRLLEAATPRHRARVAAAQRGVALHEVRVQAGVETPSLLHQARSAARRSEVEALAHQRSLTQTRQRLALLAGQAPSWGPPPGPPLVLPDLPEGADSSLLEARPDLRAALHRCQAALSRIGEARAARLPRFTLTGAYGFSSSELKELGRAPSVSWSLLPSLSLPILDGGRARIRVEAARAEAQEAQAQLQQVQRRALHEVASALDLLAEDRQALAHWTQVVEDSGKLLAARMAERGAGRSAGLAVAESEAEWEASQLQALEARRTLAQTRVLLQRALGQAWSEGEAPPWEPAAGPQGGAGKAR